MFEINNIICQSSNWTEILPMILIACFTAYIAYRQWITDTRAQRKETFDFLYENFYLKMVNFIEDIRKNKKYTDEQGDEMRMIFAKYLLLFSKEDNKAIKNLFYEAKEIIIKNEKDSIEKMVGKFEKINNILRKYMSLDVKLFEKNL